MSDQKQFWVVYGIGFLLGYVFGQLPWLCVWFIRGQLQIKRAVAQTRSKL